MEKLHTITLICLIFVAILTCVLFLEANHGKEYECIHSEKFGDLKIYEKETSYARL